MIDFGEFAPDLAEYNVKLARVAKNALPGANSYRPLKTLTAASDALDGPCVGAVAVKDNDGSRFIYAGDAADLYNITSSGVTKYSKALGYANNLEIWNFVRWANQIVASKFGNAPQVLTMGDTTFADLGGSPPQARTMAAIGNFLVFGNTNDADGNRPNRVRWSGFNDIEGWVAGTNQSNVRDLEGSGGDVQRIIGGEYGIVLQETSIWRMDYAGVPKVFEFSEIEPGRGCPSPRGMVAVGADIYMLAQDGFYVLENGSTSRPIGNEKVDRYFWGDVNESYLSSVVSAANPETGDVFWGYPSVASNDGVVDRILIFNYKIGRWSHAEVDLQLLFTGATSDYTLEDMDAFGTLETIGISLDSSAWKAGAYKLGAFDSSNRFALFSGADMPGTFETGKIFDEMRMTSLTEVRPIVDGPCTVTALTQADKPDDPEIVHGPESLDSSGKADFRTDARYHRIRVTTTGEYTKAVGVIPTQHKTGER